jgi:two-component system response regulator FixJ
MPAERTVHVVDDDVAIRRSLERLLDAAGFKVVCYDTPLAFLDAAPGLAPGCALLDIRMPGMDGLELQATLAERRIPLPVIVMTGQGDVQSAVRAMKAGAIDFIEKPYTDEVLLGAIEAALARADRTDGERDIAEAARLIATLSPREREVLEALVAGRPNKVIAFDLGISVRTVEVHRSRMMERLGVHQFAEAVRLAVMAKFGSPPPAPQAPGSSHDPQNQDARGSRAMKNQA